MNDATRRSPLALAILALLIEEPMHPYQMQQLIKERAKDDVVNVRQRASLYQTIERLLRDGLIAIQGTSRSENRPERTVYRITDLGHETAKGWTRDILATPAREFPEFPAAVAHLPLLAPAEALAQFELRAEALSTILAAGEERARQFGPLLPRVVMLEDEYQLALLRAELAWVNAVIGDLRSGRLTWSAEGLRQFAKQFSRPDAAPEKGRR